ncbi:MAG: SdiA-regulated family protein [Niastella sp.]|uniref:SdiA-regulated family protein n=1 Tax=Niastella sp. TaxID=1869183 RepID=UPI00389A8DB4
MHARKLISVWVMFLCLVILSTACLQKRKFDGPEGYALNTPLKFVMPTSLHEISGIAFYKGNPDTVYAEQDEDGKVFYLKPGDHHAEAYKFGKHGDYEDIAISNDFVIMLKSNGSLFTFPFADLHQEGTERVVEWKDLLPKGEYEAMYADEASRQIYILCKNCPDENDKKITKGYILQLNNQGQLSLQGNFAVDVEDVDKILGEKKMDFRPSALAQNPRTKEWYIIASIGKVLVVTDSNWKVTAVYHLNPALYVQPEGIAFDKNNNLYISNEGGDLHSGNILKTAWKGK